MALIIFYTFFNQLFSENSPTINVSFFVWPSTEYQWQIRVKQSSFSSPVSQRLIRASCLLLPWGCSQAGESLEARKQHISTCSSIMALSWGAHLLCCSAGAQQDDCHNESNRWKLSGTKQHSQWHEHRSQVSSNNVVSQQSSKIKLQFIKRESLGKASFTILAIYVGRVQMTG